MKLKALSCYQFHNQTEDRMQQVKNTLESLAADQGIRGLVIMGSEGLNLTISGTEPGLRALLKGLAPLDYVWQEKDLKWSDVDIHPFRFFQIKTRKEIVSLGTPELVPTGPDHHLSPREFHEALQDPETVVLDTRNWYETQMGKFQRALDPNISEFREFPGYLQSANIPKDKKVLIYCTGGIRCEKAILEMRRQGYDKVFQLEGGILKYIEEFPNQGFEGDCFVFDQRIAVDQSLQASDKYEFCATCGQAHIKGVACTHHGKAV